MSWFHKIAQASQLEALQPYPQMVEPDDGELATEFQEEIAEAFQDGTYQQRWPGLKQRPQCFSSLENFISSVRRAKPVVLNEQQLLKVYNYASVEEAVRLLMQGETDVSKQTEKGFDEMVEDENTQMGESMKQRQEQGGYSKGDSYRHKVELLTTGQSITYPVLINVNNQLCHVTGQTRQSAAVANGFVLPVKILES